MADETNITETEEWRDVVGWEGLYQVSSHGRVRSLPRDVRCRGSGTARKSGNLLTERANNCGYSIVCMSDARSGLKKTVMVHKLVSAAFLGERPKGMQVNHINNNRRHNRFDNLEYVTPKQNCQHRRVHGTFPVGENNGRARLSEEQVREIRKRRANGEKLKPLSIDYGVHQNTIWWITSGKTWVE